MRELSCLVFHLRIVSLRLILLASIGVQMSCASTERPDPENAQNRSVTAQGTLLPTGDRYEGELAGGLLQGAGSLVSHSGETYVGSFVEGLYQGQGELTFPSGDLFRGNFDQGKPSGQGVMEFANGNRYEGGWQAWLFDGEGLYEGNDGAVYEGDFAEGDFTGEGEITFENGDRYIGEVKGWRPSGEGVLNKATGARYQGRFRYGKYSGEGELKGADGELYKGKFRSGEFNGEGTLSWQAEGELQTLSGYWRKGLYAGKGWQDHLASGIAAANSEELLFKQKQVLDESLEVITPNDPNQSDLYLITFAGHGKQDVFYLETETVQKQLVPRFAAPEHTLSLVNNANTTEELPLATVTNLRYALENVSQKMDLDNDILFLFLTSHGSRTHRLSVNLPGASMKGLSANVLSEMLDDVGIRWRVVVVSACFSGGFIPPLRNDSSLIIASARDDRSSFGCSDDATLTYFGRAFFEQALPESADFETAFYAARKLVAVREIEEEYEPSEPQIHVGSAIEKKLQGVYKSQSVQIAKKE